MINGQPVPKKPKKKKLPEKILTYLAPGSTDLISLLQALRANTSDEHLYLDVTDLDSRDVEDLAQAFENCTTCLSSTIKAKDLSDPLICSFRSSKTCHTLDLSRCEPFSSAIETLYKDPQFWKNRALSIRPDHTASIRSPAIELPPPLDGTDEVIFSCLNRDIFTRLLLYDIGGALKLVLSCKTLYKLWTTLTEYNFFQIAQHYKLVQRLTTISIVTPEQFEEQQIRIPGRWSTWKEVVVGRFQSWKNCCRCGYQHRGTQVIVKHTGFIKTIKYLSVPLVSMAWGDRFGLPTRTPHPVQVNFCSWSCCGKNAQEVSGCLSCSFHVEPCFIDR